jgi:fructokinase
MLSSESLEGTESRAKTASVVVFGEVLLDCFPGGERVLGGAPFNVAWGLCGFDQSPLFISAVGDDEDGCRIRSKMDTWQMSTAGLQTDPDHATGLVRITIEDEEPSYEICEDRAWDFIEDEGWVATDMIYHGLLALRSERSRATFEALVERSGAKRFFDINLRPPYDSITLIKKWIHGVDWLKLNIDELTSLLGEKIDFRDAAGAIEHLRAEYGIHNVLLTGGSQGARIQGELGQAACFPAPKPEALVDTVGAGDSFSAYTLHGLLSGHPVDEIVRNASHFAAKVCAMQGATTLNKDFYQ